MMNCGAVGRFLFQGLSLYNLDFIIQPNRIPRNILGSFLVLSGTLKASQQWASICAAFIFPHWATVSGCSLASLEEISLYVFWSNKFFMFDLSPWPPRQKREGERAFLLVIQSSRVNDHQRTFFIRVCLTSPPRPPLRRRGGEQAFLLAIQSTHIKDLQLTFCSSAFVCLFDLSHNHFSTRYAGKNVSALGRSSGTSIFTPA